MLTPLIQR